MSFIHPKIHKRRIYILFLFFNVDRKEIQNIFGVKGKNRKNVKKNLWFFPLVQQKVEEALWGFFKRKKRSKWCSAIRDLFHQKTFTVTVEEKCQHKLAPTMVRDNKEKKTKKTQCRAEWIKRGKNYDSAFKLCHNSGHILSTLTLSTLPLSSAPYYL